MNWWQSVPINKRNKPNLMQCNIFHIFSYRIRPCNIRKSMLGLGHQIFTPVIIQWPALNCHVRACFGSRQYLTKQNAGEMQDLQWWVAAHEYQVGNQLFLSFWSYLVSDSTFRFQERVVRNINQAGSVTKYPRAIEYNQTRSNQFGKFPSISHVHLQQRIIQYHPSPYQLSQTGKRGSVPVGAACMAVNLAHFALSVRPFLNHLALLFIWPATKKSFWIEPSFCCLRQEFRVPPSFVYLH